MFRFGSKALRADAWKGVDHKIHYREQTTRAKAVWKEVQGQFQILNDEYLIKGEPLSKWLNHYGLGPLLHSKDMAVKKALNHVREVLKDTVKPISEGGRFRENELQAFKQQYGSNVTDWLFRLAPARKQAAKDKPVDFEDVEVTLFGADGKPKRTHAVSGQAWKDGNGQVSIQILEESMEGITKEEWDNSLIEEQIEDQIEV